MSIKRIKHDTEHPYTLISNYMLRDMELSLKAKAVLCMCLSFADTWKFNLNDLSSRFKLNRNLLNKCLIELETKKYLLRHKTRDEKGRVSGVIYEFFEVPVTLNCESNNQDIDYPNIENKDMEDQYVENQDVSFPNLPKKPIRNNNIKNYQGEKIKMNKIEFAKNNLVNLGRRLRNGTTRRY